jgi:hypothetical protein
MAARLQEDQELDEKSKAAERLILERVQRELRAAAAAAAGALTNPGFDEEEFVSGVAVDIDLNRSNTIMDEFFEAAGRDDDDRRSITISKSDDRARFVPDRTGRDEVEMTRRSEKNSETASAFSSVSRLTRKSKKDQGHVPQTVFIPPLAMTREQCGRDAVDDTIDGFLSGFDDFESSKPSTTLQKDPDLASLIIIKAPRTRQHSIDLSSNQSLLISRRPFNHHEANRTDSAFDEPTFNRPKFIEAKIAQEAELIKKPALPVPLPAKQANSSHAVAHQHYLSSSLPEKNFSDSLIAENPFLRDTADGEKTKESSSARPPSLPPLLTNRNRSGSSLVSPPPLPASLIIGLANNNSSSSKNINLSAKNASLAGAPIPISRELLKSLSKVPSTLKGVKQKLDIANNTNPFLRKKFLSEKDDDDFIDDLL